MKAFAKLLCLLLVLTTCLSAFAACASEDEDEATTEATTAAPDVQLPGNVDEDGYIKDELPELNYNKATFNYMCWSGGAYEDFEPEETEGELDPVSQTIIERNASVESRLNIIIEFHEFEGNYSKRNAYVEEFEKTVDGNTPYDLVAAYSQVAGMLACKGYGSDLMQTEYFNPEMPWYPTELIDETTINGKLYFVSGDISLQLIWNMYCVLYNDDLYKDLKLSDDLYGLVNKGDWTLDKMMSLSKEVWMNLDSDSKKTMDDRFGFTGGYVYMDAFFCGSGLKTVDRDEEGNLQISPTFGSSKTGDLVNKLLDFFETNDALYIDKSTADSIDWNLDTCFAEGRTLFDLRPLYYLTQVLQKQNVQPKYGVLPVPMYDDQQEEYFTAVGYPCSFYLIPFNAKDKDKSSAVLECMGSEGYRTTTPEVFFVTMQHRYSKDDATSKMFDVIRNSISFDLGRLLCQEFKGSQSNLTYSLFRRWAIDEKNRNWSSLYAGDAEVLETTLTKILEKLG